MSPALLMVVVLIAVMAKKLVDVYLGGGYQCPSCGARSESRHSHDCPWHRPS